MKTSKLKTLVAAAAVGVIALGPAAGVAFAEKPRAGAPDRAQASRYARDDNRGRGTDARQQDRGRGEARGEDRRPPGARRGDDRRRDPGPSRFVSSDDRNRGHDRRYDDRRRDRDDDRYDDRRRYDRDRHHDGRRDDRYRHDDRRYDRRGNSRHVVRTVERHYTYYDTRWNHRHYYPPRGYYYPYAPRGAVAIYYNRYRYYYGGGIWYAPRGVGWAVVAPPIGVLVSLLPTYYSTVWFGGIPYYYANDAYYVWRERERAYQVVEPPIGAQATTVSPASEDIYVYPQRGQSQEQTDFDRYECHRWAVDETGFDPTRPEGGVGSDQARAARGEYLRAMTACLEGRGYSVR